MADTKSGYHHGDLRAALIDAGLELTRAGGPDALSIRAATRRVGVSPNAAYRHFSDREALLTAVASAIQDRVAVRMRSPRSGRRSPAAQARHRLRAVGLGYIEFALDEPGWFTVAFFGANLNAVSDKTGARLHPRTGRWSRLSTPWWTRESWRPSDATVPSGRAGRRCTDSPSWSYTDPSGRRAAVTWSRWGNVRSTTSSPESQPTLLRQNPLTLRWHSLAAATSCGICATAGAGTADSRRPRPRPARRDRAPRPGPRPAARPGR